MDGKEAFMAITGDHYIGTYEGHSVELVRNNWHKTLTLLIDGHEVARELCALPHTITLNGAFEHEGTRHTVVAKSVSHFPSAADTIEVDGAALPLARAK
jgi:hypothetical protein